MKETILVVDDLPDNLWVLAEILGKEGYDPRPVTSGAEALALAATAPPDLVLLDIRMPGMDGFATCRALKDNPATRDIPVIFLSASSDLQDKLTAFERGGVDYIEKPFQQHEVLARVGAHIRLRRARLELESARAGLEVEVQARTQELIASEGRYRVLVERSPNIIYTWSDRRGLLYVNDRFDELLGYPQGTLLRRPGLWRDSIHPDDRGMVADGLAGLRLGRGYHLEYRIQDALGDWRWFDDRSFDVRPPADQQATSEATVDGVVVDITRSRSQQLMMEHLAYHDSLTELPNRKRLEQYMEELAAAGEVFALLLLDLDRFKDVNDALGHSVGDGLIVQVALRLRGRVSRAAGLLARIGGDEFAVCLRGADATAAEEWCNSLLAVLREPFSLAGLRVKVSASVGVACSPADGTAAGALLAGADIAMYAAKRRLGGFSFFTPAADDRAPFRLDLLPEFAEALEQGQLTLHYQPKTRLGDDAVAGLEALVRWNHPRRGLLPPGAFLPMVEVSDLMDRLTRWVIAAAAAQMRTWRDRGLNVGVAVNLSARNVVDDGLPAQIAGVLDQYDIPAGMLEFEITETAMMVDPERALAVLKRIADLNVGLAIDDFGVGYSSFSFVRQIPMLTVLKIDRSFVCDIVTNPVDSVVVGSMISLARGLGAAAVAEGVEDAETLAALRLAGCHQAQGYHIARPMSAEAVENWLATRHIAV